jgi:hypothetical protein
MTLTKRTDHVETGLGLFLAQFQDKTSLDAYMTTFLTQVQEIEDVLFQILDILQNITGQEGEQLDLLGRLVGQPREGRDDDLYIKWIQARLIINRASGLADEMFSQLLLFSLLLTP